MQLSSQINGTVGLLTISGNFISVADAADTREAIYHLVKQDITHVICDFANVNYMSSLGLGALIAALTTLRREAGDLRLAGVGNHVRELLTITKLDTIFLIFPSVEAANSSYASET